MDEDLKLKVDDGGRFKCDSCDFVFEVYGAYAEEIKCCPVCGSYSIWLIEPMMIQEEET